MKLHRIAPSLLVVNLYNNHSIKMSLGREIALAMLSVCLFFSAVTLQAQVERASITGTVMDPTRAALPNATVSVVDEQTNTIIPTKSDNVGSYTVRNLNPGNYTLRVQAQGFSVYETKHFVLQVSQAARLDITMAVGSETQTVEVTGVEPTLQTESAVVGQVIGAQAINQLPLNGRNIAELAVLAPGVSGLASAPSGTINSGARPDELRPGGTTLLANGARDSSNKMLLDGVDNTEMISQTFVVRPGIEGIQEFKVLTANADAAYNRGVGAILVTSTKSGSNAFHGTTYEYFRNSALDSKNYFDLKTIKIPPYKLNDLGGSLGGPLVKNHAFFFVDYEGFLERQASTVVTTVPTAAEKSGNFSGVSHIYDPTTTVITGSTYTRTEFVNDTILPAQMDPIAAQIVALYPAPQTAALVNNYVSNPVKATADNRADARVDYQINQRNTFFGRYSIDNTQLTMPNTYNNAIGGNESAFSGPDSTIAHNGVLGYTMILTPTLVAEYRFGFSKYNSFLLASPLTAAVWGEIPGRDAVNRFIPSAPIISPSGFGGLGDSRSEPQVRLEHTFENTADIAWTKGKQDIRVGFDVLHHVISEPEVAPGQSSFGRFNFDNTLTANPTVPGTTGNAIATMLLGYPSTTTRYFFLPPNVHVVGTEWNLFAQDNIRLGSKVTVNLGLHYEIDSPYYERNNEWVNFNPANGAVLLAGQNGVNKFADWNYDYGSAGPRVGISYQLDKKTVIRSGYGWFFDPQANEGTTIRQQLQWPYALAYSLVPGSITPGNKVSQGFLTVEGLPAGIFSSPFGALKGIAFNFKNTSTQQANFGVQRQLSSTASITVAYVGAFTRHLAMAIPVDDPLPGPGTIQTRRPFYAMYPNVTGITEEQSIGNAAYNSLQVSVNKSSSHGLLLGGNYVYAHALNNAGGDGGADGTVPQNPRDRRADWASASNDIKHRTNVYATYELPFGTGRRFLSNGSVVSRYGVGGWQVNTIVAAQSGYPFTVLSTGSPTNTGEVDRANLVPGVSLYPAVKTVGMWFNPAAFSVPTAYNYGNTERNMLRGPHNTNVDLTAEKMFPIREAALQFRAEMFNVLNHSQFAIPAATIGAAGVGTIISTTHAARQVQFVLKLTF